MHDVSGLQRLHDAQLLLRFRRHMLGRGRVRFLQLRVGPALQLRRTMRDELSHVLRGAVASELRRHERAPSTTGDLMAQAAAEVEIAQS
jgi:hypothetical protein